jgi:starch phosphorylase
VEVRGPESFDFQAFNVGDYYGAVHAKIEAETISKVLYPNDEPEAGKELRLKQQYFFVSCSLQDMIRLQLGIAGTSTASTRSSPSSSTTPTRRSRSPS